MSESEKGEDKKDKVIPWRHRSSTNPRRGRLDQNKNNPMAYVPTVDDIRIHKWLSEEYRVFRKPEHNLLIAILEGVMKDIKGSSNKAADDALMWVVDQRGSETYYPAFSFFDLCEKIGMEDPTWLREFLVREWRKRNARVRETGEKNKKPFWM